MSFLLICMSHTGLYTDSTFLYYRLIWTACVSIGLLYRDSVCRIWNSTGAGVCILTLPKDGHLKSYTAYFVDNVCLILISFSCNTRIDSGQQNEKDLILIPIRSQIFTVPLLIKKNKLSGLWQTRLTSMIVEFARNA
jgi:hypothetical protein